MPAFFDNSTVIQVQQASDIVDLISEHVSLNKKGREMVGLCPFHEDHRPSLYVNPVKQIFKCFACGAGGDVLKFVQMRENLTFPQAIERLAERAGIKLKPARSLRGHAQEIPADVDPNRLAKANAWAAKLFQKNLADEQKGKSARTYLNKRQITADSIKKWQIGLALSNDDLLSSAKAQNVPIDLLVKAGLVTGTDTGTSGDKFVNRLMFPITDPTARVIGFGGRTLDDKGAKYINSPTTILFDKSNSLYALDQARQQIVATETAIAVEGYTDCIMAHQFGFTNVVATMGTSFTAGQGRILRRYAKKIVLLFDSDTAGLEAANRALEVCLLQHVDIKLASVPQGKDPCDFLLAAGKEQFQKLMDNATDVFEFKWNRLKENLSTSETFVDNKTAVEEFLQTIAAAIRSGNLAAIDRGLIVNRLSKIIGLDTKHINAELDKKLKRTEKIATYSVENQKVVSIDLGQGLLATAQREILEVLLNEPKLFQTVKRKITPKSFDVPTLSQIAAVLFETLTAEPAPSLAAVLAKAESVEVGRCIVALAQAGEEKGNYQSRLTGALEVMQRYQAQKKTSQIKTVEDQREFLRRICESACKKNPHNMGMT